VTRAPAARAEPDDARTLFYLGQTRQALGDRAGALAAFRRRVELGGWDEEVFWSLYQIGRTLESAGEWVHAAQAYLSAWDHRPHRAEPLFRLAAGYRAHAHHHVALLYAERAEAIGRPQGDRLFVEEWVYEWGIDAERSISTWWVGRVEESRRLVDALLARHDLDDAYRTALESNLELLQRGARPPGD